MFQDFLAQFEWGRKLLGGAFIRTMPRLLSEPSWARVEIVEENSSGLRTLRWPGVKSTFDEHASFIEEVRTY